MSILDELKKVVDDTGDLLTMPEETEEEEEVTE